MPDSGSAIVPSCWEKTALRRSLRAFDKPVQIARATTRWTLATGPGRARFRRVDNMLTSGTTITTYTMGGVYEHILRAGAIGVFKAMIPPYIEGIG